MAIVLDDENNIYAGSSAGEEIQALGGDDSISGLGGNDTLLGGAGVDTLDGGDGNDRINGGTQVNFPAYDKLYGGAGNDTITADGIYAEMFGGAGNDVLTGSSFATLEGGPGADRLIGFASQFDSTVMSYASSAKGVIINLTTKSVSGGDATGDTYSGFYDVIGSENADRLTGDVNGNSLTGLGGNDQIFGQDGFDFIYGGDGDDTLDGGIGNDSFDGGKGKDIIRGGAGTDSLSFASEVNPVVINLVTGRHGGIAAGDTISGIENFRGSAGDDRLTGNALAQKFEGERGDDTISGGGGDDELDGDFGDDSINAGAGNDLIHESEGADTIVGGDGIDLLWLSTFFDPTSVNLSTGKGEGGFTEGDVYSGIENVRGTFYADKIIGNDAANLLDGYYADDTLTGGAGNDTLLGGAGADQITGGAGRDVVDYSTDFSDLAINLATGKGTAGNASGDKYSGIEVFLAGNGNDTIVGGIAAENLQGDSGDDSVVGGAGNDTIAGDFGDDTSAGGAGNDLITGDSGEDVIAGSIGNDTLDGGSGTDTLRGDAGYDVFFYDAVADSASLAAADTIADFVKGQDRINVDAIDASVKQAGDQDFIFMGTKAFTKEGQLRYVEGPAGVTFIEANTSGKDTAEFVIKLTGDMTLRAIDFDL